MELVTQDLIKTMTGINLRERLNAPTDEVAERWIRRQENLIIQHIAQYRWSGIRAVKRLLDNPHDKEIIVEAVMEQIEYVLTNKLVDPSLLMGITGKAGEIRAENKDAIRAYAVAPLAHEMLLNEGLLYCGEERHDFF